MIWLFPLCAALAGLIVGRCLIVIIGSVPQMIEREWVAQRGAWQEAEAICTTASSAGHPAVQILSALLFAACAWQYGLGATAFAAMGMCAALLTLAFIDVKTLLLPDVITLPLLWAGLLLNIGTMFVPLNDAVIGAALGYGVLWTGFHVFRLVTGREAMGFGDFKLCAALGAWFGWQALPGIVLLSSLAGVVVGGGMLVTGRARAGEIFPFGPYLAATGILCLLLGRNGFLSALRF